MASLKKKITTRPIPENAGFFIKGGIEYARWTDRKGRKQTCRASRHADRAPRILCESTAWYAQYRDASGVLMQVNTGCCNKDMARARLSVLLSEQEKIRAGIITETELMTAKQSKMSIDSALKTYRLHLTNKGCSPRYIKSVGRHVERARDGMGWRFMRDLNADRLSGWIADNGFGAQVCNSFIVGLKGFATWAVRRGILAKNPFVFLEHRNVRVDRRHVRRVFTDEELGRLFEAAERRPLENFITRGGSGKTSVVKDKTRERLVRSGETHAICWRVLAGTGLRLNELRSLSIAQCHLDADVPYLELRAQDEKSRRGAQIPLDNELVERIRTYIAKRLSHLSGIPGTANVVQFNPVDVTKEKAFPLPCDAVRILDLDMAFAGIQKGDKTAILDVHALRHTFCTRLANAGVPVHIAQKLMRHADPKMTLGIYSHAGINDMAKVLNLLPVIGNK